LLFVTTDGSAGERTGARRRPKGAVREGLIAAGVELARVGGPDAVVLREAARTVGVAPNATYKHFADRDELMAAVCVAAMDELAAGMAAGVGRVRGKYGDPAAARRRLRAVGRAYLEFAHEQPGLFATAFALPHQHAYGVTDRATDRATDSGTGGNGRGAHPLPLDQLRAVLDELADAGVLSRRRRTGIEYPIWSTVHGLAVLTGQGPLRDAPAGFRNHLQQLTRAFIETGLA
jgi:AcrR family transcriptional regulator